MRNYVKRFIEQNKTVVAKSIMICFKTADGKDHTMTITDKVVISKSMFSRDIELDSDNRTDLKWMNKLEPMDTIRDDNGNLILWCQVVKELISIKELPSVQYSPEYVEYGTPSLWM